MPTISPEEIRKVAKLANLKVADNEVEPMASALSDILQHIAKLESLDTEKVEPTSHVLQLENVFRPDKVTTPFEKGRSLENAPEHDKDHFAVPRIVD